MGKRDAATIPPKTSTSRARFHSSLSVLQDTLAYFFYDGIDVGAIKICCLHVHDHLSVEVLVVTPNLVGHRAGFIQGKGTAQVLTEHFFEGVLAEIVLDPVPHQSPHRHPAPPPLTHNLLTF